MGMVHSLMQWLTGMAMRLMTASAVQRFDSDARDARQVASKTLLEILRRNGHSAWGQQHRLLEISSPEAYRNQHPLTTYADYDAAMTQILAGEQNVLTLDPVFHIGLSSGTTGKQKYIPLTRRLQRQTNSYMMMVSQGLIGRRVPAAKRFGRGLVLMSASAVKTLPSGLTLGPPTGAGLKAMLPMAHLIWTSPPEAFLTTRPEDALYLHLLFALHDRSIQYISAPFASAVLDLFRGLERHRDSLLADLRRGKIADFIALDPVRRSALEAGLRVSDARMQELEQAFASGMQGIAQRLWPQLTHVASVATGPFQVYGERLRPYVGNLPMFSAIYASGEAMIGVSLEPDVGVYALTPRTAFFEFIPLEQADEAQPPTLFLHELTPGQKYEVVLTNSAGFYRYRLGDVVEAKGYYHQAPLLEFLFRRGQLLNMYGEKTSEDAALTALKKVATQVGATLVDFTSTTDTAQQPNRYRFYVEGQPFGRFSGPEVGKLLDAALQEANPRYTSPRAAQRLDVPEVVETPEGTFPALREQMIQRGASRNQAKIPRLLTAPDLLAWMERQVQG